MTSQQDGVVLVVGAEPAAFSCCAELLESGLSVRHVYPAPLGLHGSSRDIGLAYPELGEPWERLVYALGEEIAMELHRWSGGGVEDLESRFPELVRRGSRLSVTRTEQETKLLSGDALQRSKPPVNDEVRLMSGPAVSNYAPIHTAHFGAFETHAVSFAPVAVLEALSKQLKENPLYESCAVQGDWDKFRVCCSASSVKAVGAGETLAEGDLAVVAAGMATGRLLDRFEKALVPIRGQAFRSRPLKERTRSSVVGVTASWGFERYRFDDEFRLLGCGVDPSGSGVGEETNDVNAKVMRVVLNRAAQLFTDFDAEDEESLMRWAVEFDGTCDGLPILGALTGEPRIQVACGFSLSAWSRGWEAGRRVAGAVLGREDETVSRLIARCSPRRFATGLSGAAGHMSVSS